MNMKTSLVVPFYNESEVVAFFRETILNVLDKIEASSFEIICVDDDSLQQLISIAEKDDRFQAIEFSRNFGKEATLTAGTDAATGDAVIPINADLQNPPELIVEMVQKWMDGAGVVLARRVSRDSDTYLKLRTAEIFYRLHNQLSAVRIPKIARDFRLMDRSVVDTLKRFPEKKRFMKGLFASLFLDLQIAKCL